MAKELIMNSGMIMRVKVAKNIKFCLFAEDEETGTSTRTVQGASRKISHKVGTYTTTQHN